MAAQASVQALEEAAALAQEFVSTLDNLPQEITHLMSEIEHKDRRTQELQNEIQKEIVKFTKTILRNSEGGANRPEREAPAMKEKLLLKLRGSYAQIDTLAAEKAALAQIVSQKVQRARSRLDFDLKKVIALQGGPASMEDMSQSYSISAGVTRTPTANAHEALRAFMQPKDYLSTLPSLGHQSASVQSNKRKRMNTAQSLGVIKIPSPAPNAGLGGGSFGARPRRAPITMVLDTDEDAEGEEDMEEDPEASAEDTTPYCFCQKPSHGEMIGCDGNNCRYQWFHVGCLDIKGPLPDTFYCPECVEKMNAAASQKKNRKK